MTAHSDWDVVVVGAGPGGASAAFELARSGASVLLLDRARFPRSKVCGACLSPGALSAIDQMGLGARVRDAGGVTLSRLALHAGGRRADVALPGSVSLSRARLDEALVRSASSAGATFRDGVTVRLERVWERPRVRVRAGDSEWIASATVVVDATGLGRGLALPASDGAVASGPGREGGPRASRSSGPRSWTAAGATVRRAGGAPPPADPGRTAASAVTEGHAAASVDTVPGSRVGLGAAFRDASYALVAGELRMAVGSAGYVGLVRLEDGRLNVGAAVDREVLRPARPGEVVASILSEAGVPVPGALPARWRGTPTLTRAGPAAPADRVLRIGDASGYVEPFTGEGIGWALDDGLAVAALVRRFLADPSLDLAGIWGTRQRAARARAHRLCRSLARGLRHPRLAYGVVGLLGVAPALAAPFVRRAARRPSSYVARTA